MIQWTGAPTTTDATNSGTCSEIVTVTCTLIEGIDYWPDDDDERRTYETFMEGCEFRLRGFHIHPWIMEPVKCLAPVARRPRVMELAGIARRWTSGFK